MAALTDANYALVFLFASLYAHLPGLDLVRVVTFKLAFLASAAVLKSSSSATDNEGHRSGVIATSTT